MTTDANDTTPFQFGTEIRFTLRDSSYPIVNISERLDCRVDVLETVRAARDGDRVIEFVHVDSAQRERILTAGDTCERTDEIRVLQVQNGQLLAEVTVVDCVAQAVADIEGILLASRAEAGACELTVFLPPDRDPGRAVDEIQNRHPVVDVAALNKRPIAAPLMSKGNFASLLEELLTERQWEVLQIAHENGYFERPRKIHQTEIAGKLDISQETVSQHLRAAQHRLLSTIFEEMLCDELRS